MDLWWQQFGMVLKKLRVESGLSQQAMADALHIHRATYSYYELGKTQPDFLRILEIAQILAIPVETMVELLAHPERAALWQTRSRAPKKVSDAPVSLGQLHSEEKILVALYRRCGEEGKRLVRETARQQAKP